MMLLLDPQNFRRRLQYYAVDPLFRHRDVVKADVLVERLSLLGFLLVDHDPILLLHGIAAAFVEAFRKGFLGMVVVGVIERFAKQHARACARRGDERIALAKFVSSDGPDTGT